MIKINTIKIENTEEFWKLRLEGFRTNPEAFGSSYEESVETPISEVEKIINDENNYILGAFTENHQLVGIMGFRREQRKKLNHKGTIWGVYVLKDHRRKGIANELLKELLNRTKEMEGLKQINLCVVTSNNAAVELYKKFGFQSYGVEKNALIYNDQGYDEELMDYFFK